MKAKFLKPLVLFMALFGLLSCDDGIEGEPPTGAPAFGEMLSLLRANDMDEVTRFLKKADWQLAAHSDSLYDYEKTLRGNRFVIRITPMRSVEAIRFAKADAVVSEVRQTMAEVMDRTIGDEIAFTYSFDCTSFGGELLYGEQRPDALTEDVDVDDLRAFSQLFREVSGYYSGDVACWYRLRCAGHHADGLLIRIEGTNFRQPNAYTGDMEAEVRYSLSYDFK